MPYSIPDVGEETDMVFSQETFIPMDEQEILEMQENEVPDEFADVLVSCKVLKDEELSNQLGLECADAKDQDGYPTIIDILAGSPAANPPTSAAGWPEIGDIVISCNGQSLLGKSDAFLKGLVRISGEVVELQIIKGSVEADDEVERDEFQDVPGVWFAIKRDPNLLNLGLTFTVIALACIGLYLDVRVEPVCYDDGFVHPNSVVKSVGFGEGENGTAANTYKAQIDIFDNTFSWVKIGRIRTTLRQCYEDGDVTRPLKEWGEIDTFRKTCRSSSEVKKQKFDADGNPSGLVLEEETRLCREHDIAALFFYLSSIIFLFGYWIECYLSSTVKKLGHISRRLNDKVTAREHYEMVMEQEPGFQWKIECFHYEKRKRRTRGTIEYRNAKIMTHEATKHYHIKGWSDGSDPWIDLQYPLTRNEYESHWMWRSDEDQIRHDTQFSMWVDENKVDKLHKFSSTYIIPKFRKYMLEGERPSWMNKWKYALYSFFLLSWPYRIMLESRYGNVTRRSVKMVW